MRKKLRVEDMHIPTLAQPIVPSFDDAYDELVFWADTTFTELLPHRGARIASHLKKTEEEILEFLRDPSADEGIDVIFCIILWCHAQQIDLPKLMHEKLVDLRSRRWEMQPDGTLHHV